MTHSTPISAWGLALVMTVACSSEDPTSTAGEPQAAGGAGTGAPGAERPSTTTEITDPACVGFSTCFEQCYCQTQDSASCASECAMAPVAAPTSTSTPPAPTAPAPTSTAPAPTATSTAPAPTSTSTAPTPSATTDPVPPPPIVPSELMLTTETFEVGPGQEVYKCQNFANPFGQDVDIIYSESFMAPYSHHMFAFRQQGLTDSGLTDCSGLELSEYLHTAGSPEAIVTYPPGIGRFLPASDGIRIQVHYLNTSTETITAQVTFVTHYVDPSEVTAHAAAIFLNNLGVRAAPGESTATKSYTVPYDIKLLGAGSHMHRRGVNFVANVVGGPELYQTTLWDEPDPVAYDPPLDVASGQSIQWACTYQNETAGALTFGESADTNEMCIFVGTYYPAPGGSSILVNSF